MKKPLLSLLLALSFAAAPTWAQTQPPVARPANAYSAKVATEWFQLALTLTQQTPGFSPPVASRALAYLSLALYESVVPGIPGQQSLAGQLNELDSLPWAQPNEVLHWPTVANASMAAMTRMMFPNASAENKARIEQLERNLPLRLSQDFNPTQVNTEITQRSETFGKLMAMAIMTWARTDGGHEGWAPLRRNQAVYVPPSGPGRWSATPPSFAPALLPWWGDVRPFALHNSSECEAPPPPPYAEKPDSAFYKEAQEVYKISNAATQAQRQVALYWADEPLKTPTPAGHWNFIATDLLQQQKSTLAQAASAYVQINIAMADAFVASWKTKYTTHLIRPVTYVQLVIDSNWEPGIMPTPPFPEFPSGHSVQSSAAAQVMAQVFGAHTAFTDNTHNDRGWGPRTFSSFQAAANEAAVSRLYAGIHFRSGVESGQVQGRCVGQKALGLKLMR